jgi:hypothetical protein
MASQQFVISCLGVGITERSIQVVVPPGMSLVSMHIFSKFLLWTLTPEKIMLLEMM